MAYTADDWRFIIEGMVGPSEAFSNTWAFTDVASTGDPQDIANHLNQFYLDLAGLWSPAIKVNTCRYRNLSTTVETVASFTPVVGSASSDMLPSQCAMRVSLNSALGKNGGPFLPAFCIAEVSSADDGLLPTATQTTITTALTNLNNNVTSDDWVIGIDRPTVPEVVNAARGRIGRRYDVIRKRSNDTPEAYSTVALG